MGVVEEVGAGVTDLAPGDRVVIPFQIAAAPAGCASTGLQSQCETTQVREQGTGAALFGYSKLYGEVAGGQAEYLRVPQAQYAPIKVPDGPPDDRFVYLSDVLPTAWQAVAVRRPRAGGHPARPRPRPDRRHGVPHRPAPRGPPGDRRRPRRRPPRPGPRARCHDASTCGRSTTSRTRCGTLTGGRGADAVIDAVGMEAHGSPLVKARPGGGRSLPDALAKQLMTKVGVDRLAALHTAIERGAPRRHGLAERRLRRDGRPDADDDAVRQAGADPDGPGQRQALGRRDPAAAHRRPTPSGVDDFATHRLPLEAAPDAYADFQAKETAWSRWCSSPSSAPPERRPVHPAPVAAAATHLELYDDGTAGERMTSASHGTHNGDNPADPRSNRVVSTEP